MYTLGASGKLWYACFLFIFCHTLFGQSTGDYRTKAAGTGLWNTVSSWERYNGSTWVDATLAPNSSDGAITVVNGFTINITTAITIDQTTVDPGGKVVHSGAATVTLADGAGTDLIINGTWTRTANLNTINRNIGATISVGSTGVYEQALTASGGSIPVATWDNNSVLRLMNNHSGNTSYSNLNQTFGIIEYNRPNQTTDHNDLTPDDVTNELRIISTGSGSIRLQGISITGSYKQTGGKCKITSSSGNIVASVGSNFTLESGSFWMSDASGSANTVDLSINGDCSISGGDFQFATTSSTSAASFLKCKGDLRLSGGTISGFLPGATGFYFNGTGVQTLDIAMVLGTNTRNSFWYLTASGPAGLNETYSGTTAQETVTGSRTNPGGNWAPFPTTGSILKTLTINNSAGVQLARNLMVNTSLLFLNGTMTPGSFSLTLNSGAVSSGYGPGKYIEGPCSKVGTSTFLFPVGKSGNYAPIEISNISTSSTFTAEYFGDSPSNSTSIASGLHHISASEYWTLNQTAGSGSAMVNLYWESTRSGSISVLDDLRVARFNGSEWVNEGNTGASGNTSAGSVFSGTVTSFNPFTLASSSSNNLMGNVLPVELLYFSAKMMADAVLLEWSTASEQNSDYFTMERSGNGWYWEELRVIKAAGYSAETLRYSLTDDNPLKGFNYYRLKQTDWDGSTAVYPIVSVQNLHHISRTITLYPTPMANTLTIAGTHPETPLPYHLLNSNGQILCSGLLENNLEYIDVSTLAPGPYWLQLDDEAGTCFLLIKQ